MQYNWLKDEGGYTLMEALVGLAILVLLVTAVTNLEMQAYRTKTAYNAIADGQAHSFPGLEWIVRDIRQSVKTTGAPGTPNANGSNLTLTVGSQTVSYALSNGVLQRTDQNGMKPVASGITSLTFTIISSTTIRVQMQVALDTGVNYSYDVQAVLRSALNPAQP